MTLLGTAALLALASFLLDGERSLVAALAALVAVPPGAVKAEPGLLHEEDSTSSSRWWRRRTAAACCG